MKLAKLLLLIGGLNWLLYGLFAWEVGQVLGGGAVEPVDGMGIVPRIIYILVGLSALMGLKMLAGGGRDGGMPQA